VPITTLTCRRSETAQSGSDYSPFTDAGGRPAGLTELRRLMLRDSMVTDEGLKHLRGLVHLKNSIFRNQGHR
jgi:hypothetical protein